MAPRSPYGPGKPAGQLAGVKGGPDATTPALGGEVADGSDGVEAGLIADLGAEASIVDAAPESKQAHTVAVNRAGAELPPEPLQRRADLGVRDGQLWPPG